MGDAVVLLGNAAPLMRGGVAAEHLQQSVTRVELPDGYVDADWSELALSTANDTILTMIGRTLAKDDKQYALALRDFEGLWPVHSAVAPAWVASEDDPDLARLLGRHFGCPVGEPSMLLTTNGRDVLHQQHIGGTGAGAQPAVFQYMAVANNATATAPAASDTALTGEVVTAGGGLLRAVATFAHTAGTNTTTLSRTLTANGSDSLPVTLSQVGIFNAASGVTLGYKTALNANATLTVSGDNVSITWTDTVG